MKKVLLALGILAFGGGAWIALFPRPGAAEDLPPGALREIFETNLFGLHDLTTRAISYNFV